MVGEHKLIVKRRKLVYEITLRHKFNVILGDSGSGKSLLETLIYESSMGFSDNIKVISNLNVGVVRFYHDIEMLIKEGKNLLVFDELSVRCIVKEIGYDTLLNLLRSKSIYCIFMTRNRITLDEACYYKLILEEKDGITVIRNM